MEFNAFVSSANHGIFSRLTSVHKHPEAERTTEVEVKTDAATSAASWWADDFEVNFLPPPPRPPFLEGKVEKPLKIDKKMLAAVHT